MIYIAETEDANKRIDVFLNEEIEDISRSAIQKNIENGNILVNGKKVGKNYKLSEGDGVSVELPEPVEIEILPENIPLDILYEDKDVIVINKPQDMVVHPAPGHYTGTLVNALMYHCGDELSGINGVLRPGIVHRIDKDTSGILVAAKSDRAHISLSKQLAEHTMTREYWAIVYNGFDEESGTVDQPIGRHPAERKKMAVVRDKTSRHAVTHYSVIKKLKGNYTLVKLRLETGRTHQIRVHMAYIHHPLLGDEVYGPKKCPFNLKGQVLHAKILGFVHPATGEYMEFESPLPKYFEDLIEKI
ncbi:MAG: RluA family pseudouridine synthase [Firmicutes bacterium]|nr:RluA family pseudouridine synthase [Bacillota bacterium]